MLDSHRIGQFIAAKRRELGYTQQQLAEQLHISFQAISKWENGSTYPNIELLYELASILQVSVDELLAGNEINAESFSYSKAGIDISYTDTIKKEMARHLTTSDPRVLNGLGPFASLYDIHFPSIEEPVLVLKSEEPGSKQKLAMEYGYTESICHDMINHLVNDIMVMGARPLAVLDTIVCGNAEKDTITSLVKGMADACRVNDCSLVGGETSIQPQVVEKGTYVLTSSIAGIAERKQIIDGSRIQNGDVILALASNGLHTNGYSLVRLLMDKMPQIKLEKIDGETVIEQLMKPHTAYYPILKDYLNENWIHGMAHITGGGIEGNLCRILPPSIEAVINLSQIQTLPLFSYLKAVGGIRDNEMLQTFNCGVGLILIAPPEQASATARLLNPKCPCYPIGTIIANAKHQAGSVPASRITFENHLRWS